MLNSAVVVSLAPVPIVTRAASNLIAPVVVSSAFAPTLISPENRSIPIGLRGSSGDPPSTVIAPDVVSRALSPIVTLGALNLIAPAPASSTVPAANSMLDRSEKT